MFGFKDNKVENIVKEEPQELQQTEAVQQTKSRLGNQQLAYTDTTDISYVAWIRDNIDDPDVDPYISCNSNYNDDYVSSVLKSAENEVSADLPADYVPQADVTPNSGTSKIEVNVF